MDTFSWFSNEEDSKLLSAALVQLFSGFGCEVSLSLEALAPAEELSPVCFIECEDSVTAGKSGARSMFCTGEGKELTPLSKCLKK